MIEIKRKRALPLIGHCACFLLPVYFLWQIFLNVCVWICTLTSANTYTQKTCHEKLECLAQNQETFAEDCTNGCNLAPFRPT